MSKVKKLKVREGTTLYNHRNNVLFVIPRNKSRINACTDTPYYPHLGVASLLAFMKKHGYVAQVFDAGLYDRYKGITGRIEKIHPVFIGVTTYSYSYPYVLETIELLKSLTSIPVVVGGPHVTATKKEILQNSQADFGVVGEGELTVVQLANALSSDSSDFSMIRGLIWRKGKEVIENAPQIPIQDLDNLPYPDFESFDIKHYPSYSRRSLPLLTERGCPYPCTFCSMRKTGFRPNSPKRVVEEIEHWVGRGFIHFDVNDDVFNFDPRRVMAICDLIIKKKLDIKYELYNGIRADKITFKMLQKLKKSGCIFLSYGLESGTPEILTRIQKRISLEQVRQAVEWTKEVGIPFSVNFIIGHPGEKFETAMESVSFAETLPATWVNFYNLVPFPGTPTFNWVKKNGHFLVPLESYLYEVSYRNNKPVFETDVFTESERMFVMQKGTNLYNKSALIYRFGKVFGTLIYVSLRSKMLLKLGRYFFTRTEFGKQQYGSVKRQTQTLIKTLFFQPTQEGDT